MPISANADQFLSEMAHTLNAPREMSFLLGVLPFDSPVLFDLTFHASFASKMFALLKREGQNVQGFERMQQSLKDSVETITMLLERTERDYSIDLGIKRANTIAQLIADLTTLKQWMLQVQEQ